MIQNYGNCLNVRQLNMVAQKSEFINCRYLILVNALPGINI